MTPMFNMITIPVAQAMVNNGEDPALIVGFMAYVNQEFARYFDGFFRDRLLAQAHDNITWAYANIYDPVLGMFDGGILDSNNTMLIATAGQAYHTQDPQMLAYALDLMTRMDEELFDTNLGGYWDSLTSDRKYLSGNSMTHKGIINLYEATGDIQYRLKAEAMLTWMETDLYFEGLLYHHWDDGVGRATYYCTGCNFLLLNNIFRMHQIGLIDVQ